LLIIWGVYFASLTLPLQQYGLIPRTSVGLIGIFSSPFLHGSWQHLLGNSISFTFFAIILALLEGEKMFIKMFLMVLIGGSLTWLMGRDANHIGASGLIFALWSYLLLAGWFSKSIKYIIASLFLIFFYSGMIFGVLPGKPGISFEGHLFGAVAGVIVAWIYHKKNRDIGNKKGEY